MHRGTRVSVLVATTLTALAMTSGCGDSGHHRGASWFDYAVGSRAPTGQREPPSSTGLAPHSTAPGPETPAEATRHRLQSIDLCAMHDPASALQVTKGEAPDSLMPAEDFTDCTLTLHRPALSTPDYTIAIGIDTLDEATIQQGQATQIGGLTFYVKQLSGSNDRHETTPCVVYLPQPDGYTLNLQVSPPVEAFDAAVPVCDVATAYLSKTARRWRTPPTHADQRTDPPLPLASADPCSITAIPAALGNGRVLQADLHECMFTSPLTPANGTNSTPAQKLVEVQYQFDDPATITNRGDPTFKQSTIAGVPVAQHDYHSSTQGCVTSFRVGSASVTIDEDAALSPRVQIAEVTATTCALSSQAAQAVIQAVR